MKRVLLALFLVGCGGSDPKPQAPAPEPKTPEATRCADEPWGGFDGQGFEGQEACGETAARVVDGAARTCVTDADCSLVGTNCDAHAVNMSSVDEYSSWPQPCTDPRSGECMGPDAARCSNGCCVAQ